MTGTLQLVDTANLYFRAYHGIPVEAVRAADGTPVNAVRGFADMLATLIRTRNPRRLVCALDADWRPAWRVNLVASYKTHRLAPGGGEVVPDPLGNQVPIILELLETLGIATLGVPGFEADDVMGTLAARETGPIEVVSGDRDLIQVVDDHREVRVLYCGRGVSRLEVLDDAAVLARYGVPARWYADFATLRGDPSDGLPGVPGIGAKTAAQLVMRYQGLDGVLAVLATEPARLAPAVRTQLLAQRDYLDRARQVVELRRDVPVPSLDPTLPVAPAGTTELLRLAERWNLAGPVTRLVDALAATPPAGIRE